MKTVGVLAFHPAFTPPRSGGELRLYNLYHRVAERGFGVHLLTPTYSDHAQETVQHSERFRETRFPKLPLHNRLHHLNDRLTKFAECSGLVCSLAARHHVAMRDEAARLAAEVDVLTQAYAFLTPLIPRRRRARQVLVYDAHNVEADLAATMFGSSPQGLLARWRVSSLERRMLRESDAVLACSDEDAQIFVQRFGVERAKLVVIPNGVDIDGITPVPDGDARCSARGLLALSGNRPACFFIGSFHPPNITAARLIIDELAAAHPDADFLLAGKVCNAFESAKLPGNVRLLGLVSEEQKLALFHGCDVALNPMLSGSGTNLKMLDYLAAGLPILTTEIGARGLAVSHCQHASVQTREGLINGLGDLLADDAFRLRLGQEARALAVERYDWRKIGDEVANLYDVKTGRRVVVLNDYPVMPAQQGGQVRIDAVLRTLAEDGASVSLLTLGTNGYRRYQEHPRIEEVNIPRSFWHRRLDMRLNAWMGCGCDDVSAILVGRSLLGRILLRNYRSLLRRELRRADAVLLSHPYMEPLTQRLPTGLRLFYDSHNTEHSLKEKLYKPGLLARFLIRAVRKAEFAAARRSEAVYCVSEENRQHLLPDVPGMENKGQVAPNGVNCSECIVRSPADKRGLKRLAGLPTGPTAIFLGSGHPPNAEAARIIREQLAPQNPEITFLLVGNVCGWFHGLPWPANVMPMGMVSSPVKAFLLQLSDVALNPMLTGSGTSLKLFDYLAHGLPVITTAVGARGLEREELEAMLVCEPDEFSQQLRTLIGDEERMQRMARHGRWLAETRYDWSVALAPMRRISQTIRS